MSIRLTILCENSVERVSPRGLLGEHGFACHLQTDQGDFLFDTGGGLTLLHNSHRMGIDLRRLQGIILSHGHLDHTGGLQQVLEQLKGVQVYGHPDVFRQRHSRNGNQLRSIGIPWGKTQLEALGADFELDSKPQQITSAVTLSGEIPRHNEIETGDSNLVTTDANGKAVTDPLTDDLSLFINSKYGLIILLGCAHAGLLNIIDYARKVTGQQKIHLLLGGTHLKFCTMEQFDATLKQLEKFEIDRLGASHCTGLRQAQMLAERFGERFFSATVGTEINLPA
jgi:7,8-dihydropterin-6-yl-methyl-4-(beta-D-ribofuranosyl)aminobenzene 5'-phosphate synthase